MNIDLNEVAKYQRWLLLAILLQLCVTALYIAIALGAFEGLGANPKTMTTAEAAKIEITANVILASRQVAIATSITFMILLMASMKRPIVICVLAGVGTLFPFMGLVVLILVNSSAAKLLKGGGYQFGLMGAKSK